MTFAEYLEAHRKLLSGKKPTADISERWQTRMLLGNLHLRGEEGAQYYLNMYGKNIAAPKVIGLAHKADVEGYPEVAVGFWKKAFELETGQKAPKGLMFSIDNATVIIPERVAAPVEEEKFTLPHHLQPGNLVTMQPVDAAYGRDHYIDDPDYLGQPKRDGNRLVVIVDSGRVFYQSRSLKLRASPDPQLGRDLLEYYQTYGNVVLDGELVYYDYEVGEHRTGSQANTFNVDHKSGFLPVMRYCVFEVLYANGTDWTQCYKVNRIQQAQDFITRIKSSLIHIVPTAWTMDEKRALANRQKLEGREGEVWTQKHAEYVGGKEERRETTVRTKYRMQMIVEVIHLTPTTAAGRPFGAIEVGQMVNGNLKHIGSVGTGYTVHQMRKLYDLFNTNRQNGADTRIEVSSQGLTENGQIWHGVFEDFA